MKTLCDSARATLVDILKKYHNETLPFLTVAKQNVNLGICSCARKNPTLHCTFTLNDLFGRFVGPTYRGREFECVNGCLITSRRFKSDLSVRFVKICFGPTDFLRVGPTIC